MKFKSNRCFIGEGVRIDTLYPEEVVIGHNCYITTGVHIITHCLDTSAPFAAQFNLGHVEIGDYTFVGANTIICQRVTIGRNCIIGAGSVVTKDIPDNEVWAGNPARFIRKRNTE